MEAISWTAWRMGFLLALLTQAEATHNAFEEAVVKKLCNLATSLQNAASVANNKLFKLAAAAEAATAAKAKLLIEALTTENNDTAVVFAAVAMQGESCGRSNTEKLKEHIPKALAATTITSIGAGALISFVEMLQRMTDTGSRKCISSRSGTASILLQDPTKLDCPAYAIQMPADSADFDAKHIKAEGFTEFAANPTSLIIDGDNNCALLKGGGATAAHLWGSGPTKIINGLIDITGDSATNAAAGVEKADNIAEALAPANPIDTMAKQLMKAGTTVNNIPPPSCPAAEEQLLDHLLNPENLKPHLTTALKGLKRQTKGKEEQQITANNGPNQ
uniref:Variant surface glycoprotein 1125.5323 n=1 Tax=Trypanosoma brucei TaxID=5691 RepID=A0A1J0RC33_9TRYP|nr:variant surface glycoprotein 1125.5323 [Trypanosoma brucei]